MERRPVGYYISGPAAIICLLLALSILLCALKGDGHFRFHNSGLAILWPIYVVVLFFVKFIAESHDRKRRELRFLASEDTAYAQLAPQTIQEEDAQNTQLMLIFIVAVLPTAITVNIKLDYKLGDGEPSWLGAFAWPIAVLCWQAYEGWKAGNLLGHDIRALATPTDG